MRIDLHTHSLASPDGSLKLADYEQALDKDALGVVAITDHDRIDFAVEAQRIFGEERIIIGEEITTLDGEIIGLYLTEKIEAGQTAEQTVAAIRNQGGLVYVPHPFETVRKGLQSETLKQIIEEVDILEVHNGRAIFQNKSLDARMWAQNYKLAPMASSDAHGTRGWLKTYADVTESPTKETLVNLLHNAKLVTGTVGVLGLLYPKYNRLVKKRKGSG